MIVLWRPITVEDGSSQQNHADCLLSGATGLFRFDGRHFCLHYAGEPADSDPDHDSVRPFHGSVDWFATYIGCVYGSDIRKVYQVSGIPGWVGFVLPMLSAFCHLLLMSVLLFGLSFLCFGGEIPSNLQEYVLALILLLLTSLFMAGVVGLGVKDQAKTSLFSILLFLPSILLSGVFFPAELLSPVLEGVGKCFPAFWGSRLLMGGFHWTDILPLAGLLFLYGGLCILLLKKS